MLANISSMVARLMKLQGNCFSYCVGKNKNLKIPAPREKITGKNGMERWSSLSQ